MLNKEILLSLLSEEKNTFAQYSQLCAQYQIDPDPIAQARHLGRLESFQSLLDKKAFKI